MSTYHVGPAASEVEVSLVAPARNEQQSLVRVCDEVREAMRDQHREWELILVDDGSADDSWRVIVDQHAADSRVRGLRLRRNFGKAAALAAGVAQAQGKLLVTLDADGQDTPAEIPRLLTELDHGTDLVSGYKTLRQDPWDKTIPSKIFNWITGVLTGLKLTDHNCGLKAGRTEVYRRVPLYGELHRYIPTLAHQLGYRVRELPVRHRERVHGKSHYGFERYIRGALDLVTVVALTRYGRRPGHLFGGLGVLFGILGTAILMYLTGVWLFTAESIGTRPLLTLGMLLEIFGVQMVSVGLLAELVLHRTKRDDDVAILIEEHTSARQPENADP